MTIAIYSDYIDERIAIDSMFNHTALEALLRAVEDDIAFNGRGSEGYIDIRAADHAEAILNIRALIRQDCFILDLIKNNNRAERQLRVTTPYGRNVKPVWSTPHFAISTSKGWVVFDHPVHTQEHVD